MVVVSDSWICWNQVSECDACPLPQVDDLLKHLGKAWFPLKWINKYWWVALTPEAEEKKQHLVLRGDNDNTWYFHWAYTALLRSFNSFQTLSYDVITCMALPPSMMATSMTLSSSSWKDHLHPFKKVLVKLRWDGLQWTCGTVPGVSDHPLWFNH